MILNDLARLFAAYMYTYIYIRFRTRYAQDLETPLHTACQRGHLDLVEELLARGAGINRKNIVSEHV